MIRIVARPMDVRAKNDLKKQQKPKGEKMRKTLLSMAAGLAVIGNAIAVPSLGTQQQNCEEDPNFVWVECRKTCVPINPCLSGDRSIRNTYCFKFFEYTRLRKDFLEMPINVYLDLIADTTIKEYSIVDDVYVATKRADGCYQVFEFADIYPENSADGAGVADLFKVAKMLYGFGDPGEAPTLTILSPCRRSFLAAPIMKKDCIKLVDFYRDFAKTRFENMDFNYNDDTGRCEIFVDVTSDQCIYD